MRLLNVESFKLESYDNVNAIPHYVILSHRWEEDEILFQDLQEVPQELEIRELRQSLRDMEQRFERLERILKAENDTVAQLRGSNPQQENFGDLNGRPDRRDDDTGNQLTLLPHLNRARQKEKGWNKISRCCNEARVLGFSYVWIDTCCINKESSSELSEAINSMFSWYRNATVCIAYLSDVSSKDKIEEFRSSKWFTRGWTLQELIAPDDVWFYSQDWEFLGLRSTLAATITAITSVSSAVLHEKSQTFIGTFSVAARLSWAAIRVCTREEDRSYSLLGLFEINMPSIYGEGKRAAFLRLQFEIFRVNPDHSIFAWESHYIWGNQFMFANHVESFTNMSSIVSADEILQGFQPRAEPAVKQSKVSHGLRIWLPVRPYAGYFQACLYCKYQGSYRAIGISVNIMEGDHFMRRDGDIQELELDTLRDKEWFMKEAFISYPGNDLTGERFSSSRRLIRRLRVYDEQVLGYGFERISFPVDFTTDAKMSGVPLTDATSSFFQALANSRDLSSENIPFSLRETRQGTGAYLYLNRDTMALFALTVEVDGTQPRRKLAETRIAVIEPSNLEDPPSFLPTGMTSKTLKSGWHVFIHAFILPGRNTDVHLNVKPVTPLSASHLMSGAADSDGNGVTTMQHEPVFPAK